MPTEPTLILEVDRRLAQFIRSCRPLRADHPNALELGRWHAAQEVRKILQDACPYPPGSAESHAWFVEKYGDAAGAVIAND
jgi:hypothetical protein